MIRTRCSICGAVLVGVEMSARTLAHYLRRTRLTQSVPALRALADEIERRFGYDEAARRLIGVIAAKAARLAAAN